jgi:hypothetical protein
MFPCRGTESLFYGQWRLTVKSKTGVMVLSTFSRGFNMTAQALRRLGNKRLGDVKKN